MRANKTNSLLSHLATKLPSNSPNIETESSLPAILTSLVTRAKETKWKWREETNYEVSSRLQPM